MTSFLFWMIVFVLIGGPVIGLTLVYVVFVLPQAQQLVSAKVNDQIPTHHAAQAEPKGEKP